VDETGSVGSSSPLIAGLLVLALPRKSIGSVALREEITIVQQRDIISGAILARRKVTPELLDVIAQAEPILKDFAKVILQDTALRSLLIVGHTDSIGGEAYNVNLSKQRAFTVATTLQASGVVGKYIHIVPMGKQQPFATNSTPKGRQMNRRVEFFISDIPEATETALRRIEFDPCFRNDHEPGAPCDATPKRIPIFSPDSDSKPVSHLNLTTKASERPRLPDITMERRPLKDSDDSESSK
jgi:OmpA family